MGTLLKLVGVNCRWGCRIEILGPPIQAVPTVNVSVHTHDCGRFYAGYMYRAHYAATTTALNCV